MKCSAENSISSNKLVVTRHFLSGLAASLVFISQINQVIVFLIALENVIGIVMVQKFANLCETKEKGLVLRRKLRFFVLGITNYLYKYQVLSKNIEKKIDRRIL